MGRVEENLEEVNYTIMREGTQLSQKQRESLISSITEKEIRDALSGIIGDNKTLGIDGYGASFFKNAWHIVEVDVCKANKGFFTHGRLHRCFNCTVVALIPNNVEAKIIKEYRPISCCTTIYNIISKILTCRLGKVISHLVAKNQTAFVKGQHLCDHVLLAFELLKGYDRNQSTPKCMMQIDLQKSYDMVDWRALEKVL
ncbi:uncharacterized protein LOC131624384 [Vicia villosa]|uniref:uncharacterized protein LOC131624384 n=1 Tax=Vicia villosa TaxID=3911 RepID=UPI00273CDE76|nr:uncharacterized protein LOC131624384 [Vicia villosa]